MAVKQGRWPKRLGVEWETAHHELLLNVQRRPFVSRYEQSVYTSIGGRKVYLPAYVPYIGPKYFEYRPRILCYAINQNLSPHVPWTKDWVTCWATDMECAWDRLNRAAREGQPIPIRPYAEGFIPLIALIAGRRWIQTHDGCLPRSIDDVVAVTNFIKFSTAEDASSSSIPSIWWRECGSQYVGHEIQVLRPDIIIGFGQKTFTELRRILQKRELSRCTHELLKCRFPARIPSIKSRSLSGEEAKLWNEKILLLVDRMCEPKQNSYHKWKIQQFPGYFLDAITSWGSTL